MRLEQYLIENDEFYSDGFIKQLQKDCGEWISELKSNDVSLYRGMDNGKRYLIKTPRQDREPLSGYGTRHKVADELFKKRFGWKGRSESVLCTTELKRARNFGSPHIIFPFDGYQYIWSKDVYDFLDIDEDVMGVSSDHSLDYMLKSYPEEYTMKFKEFIDDNYTDKTLDSGKNYEVMLKCKKYYAFNVNFDHDIIYLLRMLGVK